MCGDSNVDDAASVVPAAATVAGTANARLDRSMPESSSLYSGSGSATDRPDRWPGDRSSDGFAPMVRTAAGRGRELGRVVEEAELVGRPPAGIDGRPHGELDLREGVCGQGQGRQRVAPGAAGAGDGGRRGIVGGREPQRRGVDRLAARVEHLAVVGGRVEGPSGDRVDLGDATRVGAGSGDLERRHDRGLGVAVVDDLEAHPVHGEPLGVAPPRVQRADVRDVAAQV